MLIVPELKTVIITPPRTGSTALRKAVLAAYPDAINLYRHMEADGIPDGYDRWQRIGIFRPPRERLFSVYKYCKITESGTPEWRQRQRAAVNRTFEDWLIWNEIVFTNPYDSAALGFYPFYNIRHSLPENKKSLYLYLRPDLGVKIKTLRSAALHLSVSLPVENASDTTPPPALSEVGTQCLRNFHGWDLMFQTRLEGEGKL